MLTYGAPVAYALILWWTSTIAILYLDGLPRRTYPWSLIGASALACIAFVGIVATRDDPSLVGAYHAFACGLAAWAWQILTFYMGFITGPSKSPCPPGLRGRARFVAALRTCLHHELAIVAMGAGVAALLAGAENRLALWTFVILWWMHASAKLNVFFGVRNLGEEFVPHHLRYLFTYMRRRPMNGFFPLSITISTAVTILLIESAVRSDGPEATAFAMLATLMALAVLEHWLLVTPFDANMLWKWGVKDAPGDVAASAEPVPEAGRAAPSPAAARAGLADPPTDLIQLECVQGA